MISNNIKYIDEIIKLSDKKDIISNNPFTKFYVYVLDNKVVSFLVFDDIYDRIEIIYIYTDPLFRGNNLATLLFNKLISEYESYNNITLEVNKNNLKAINLYKKVGFECVSIRNNYYNGIDGILMELKLKGK